MSVRKCFEAFLYKNKLNEQSLVNIINLYYEKYYE